MTLQSSKSVFQRIVTHPAFLLITGLVIVAVSLGLANALMRILYPQPVNTDISELIVFTVISAFCVFGYWLFTHYVERKPFADFGLPGAAKEWLFGIAIGAGVMSLVVGIIALLGGYKVVGQNGPDVLIGVLGVAIISGITEEILFRGDYISLF